MIISYLISSMNESKENKQRRPIALIGPLDQAAALTLHLHQYPYDEPVTTVALGALTAEQLQAVWEDTNSQEFAYTAVILLGTLGSDPLLVHLLTQLQVNYLTADKNGVAQNEFEALVN